MNVPTLFYWLAIPCYLISVFLIFRGIRSGGTERKFLVAPKLLWAAGLLFHMGGLTILMFTSTGLNLSFPNALSMVAWFVSLLLFFSVWRHPLESLALVVLPFVTLALLTNLLTPPQINLVAIESQGIQWHVLSSLLSFSLFALGATQALLLSYQERKLRTHKLSGWVRHLPPLQHMENFLFQLLALGFTLLSISLITGWIFIDDIFAQHLVHKTVLSMTAWVVFAVLLLGRFLSGWRGQQAIRWTLWGFAFLALAYFGSKFVLEIILPRA